MKAENMHFHITLLWYKKLSVIIRQPLIPVPLSLALILHKNNYKHIFNTAVKNLSHKFCKNTYIALPLSGMYIRWLGVWF